MFSRSATAGTVYSAHSEVNLMLTAILDGNSVPVVGLPAGLDLEMFAIVGDFAASSGTGFATASADGLLNGVTPVTGLYSGSFDLGDSLFQSLSADGGTVSPADFAASVGFFVTGIAGTNSTLETYTLRFQLSYAYQISSTVDDPMTEFAYAQELIFAIDGFGNDLLQVYDLVDFTNSSSDSGVVTFDLVIDPSSSNGFGLYHLSGGDPPPAPEPTTLVLAACGGLGLAFRNWKKQTQRRCVK
ncbi:MAG: hypothetical protein NT069_14755 [Planctomycetota bacterium]|nr:hypothetical protein [Planctomycetota bacterium]